MILFNLFLTYMNYPSFPFWRLSAYISHYISLFPIISFLFSLILTLHTILLTCFLTLFPLFQYFFPFSVSSTFHTILLTCSLTLLPFLSLPFVHHIFSNPFSASTSPDRFPIKRRASHEGASKFNGPRCITA